MSKETTKAKITAFRALTADNSASPEVVGVIMDEILELNNDTPQDLQSVLNEGSYAELDGANSAINILTGDVNNRIFDLYVNNGANETSGLDMSNEWNYLYGNSVIGNRKSQIGIELNGQVYLQQRDYNNTLIKTRVLINTPVNNTTLSFPAKLTDGNYIIATLDDIVDFRPYKVYSALISQSGTNDPTAIILENTLSGTITWTRTGVGYYLATLTGAFPNAQKVGIPGISPSAQARILAYHNNIDSIEFYSSDYNNVPSDIGFFGQIVEIRIYN